MTRKLHISTFSRFEQNCVERFSSDKNWRAHNNCKETRGHLGTYRSLLTEKNRNLLTTKYLFFIFGKSKTKFPRNTITNQSKMERYK